METKCKLKIRALELAVVTPKGKFGAKFTFDDGLNVLRAENTSGKSTCVHSIIYGLGLELMLSANREIPLPHVMTSQIESDGEQLPVVQSDVYLEIENSHGEILTTHRAVKGSSDTRLVSTWNGPALTKPGNSYEKKDYFALDAGAATREDGFHKKLAAFIGWDLPMVTKFNGSECLLYMEAVFPLLIIEQKHGWSALQARLPTFLGIQEMGKRAIEFILNLDAHKNIVERQRILREEDALKQNWSSEIIRCEAIAKRVSGIAQDISTEPVSSWPPKIEPEIRIPSGKSWVSLDTSLRSNRNRLKELETQEIPTVQETVAVTEKELAETRDQIASAEAFVQDLFSELTEEREHHTAIATRLTALREDLIRNNDAVKLKKYGSDLNLNIANDKCPTCQQTIADSLLDQKKSTPVMSLSENIEFIKAQIESFETMTANSQKLIEAKEASLAAADQKMNELRTRIRDLKQTLISDGRLPSLAAIRERISVSETVSELNEVRNEFKERMKFFEEMSNSWKELQGRLAGLPKGVLSDSDSKKLKQLEELFVEQASKFGFKSFPVDSLTISRDTYRPTREGFDLGFEISASDNIRLIWAYLTTLLELGRLFVTNHCGLLIFDEPRQQAAKEVSFAELLKRAARSKTFSQQVIFATSEPKEQLESALKEHKYKMFHFTDFILTRSETK